MTEKRTFPTKYRHHAEEMRVIKHELDQLDENLKTMMEDIQGDYAEAESRFNTTHEARDNLNTRVANSVLRNTLTEVQIMVLLRQITSRLAELTESIMGHEEVRVRVKKNFEKEMKAFVEYMEAARKAQESYTR